MPTYADLDLDLTPHPGTLDVMRKLDVDAIRASLRNILLTNRFEQPFLPDYGVGIQRLLFENMSPAWDVITKRTILEQISAYEPRAVVENIDIISEYDSNDVTITIDFYVRGLPDQFKFDYTLQRVR